MQYDEVTRGLAKPEQSSDSSPPFEKPGMWAGFFESSSVGFAVCDERLRYLFVNDALANMNGVSATAHLGKPLHEILGDRGSRVTSLVRTVFATGESLSKCEFEAKLPDHTETARWLASYFPIKDARSQVRQVGMVVLEIPGPKEADGRRLTGSRAHQLVELVEFGTLLLSKTSDHKLFDAISNFLRATVDPDFASVALYDEQIGQFRVYPLEFEAATIVLGAGAAARITENVGGPAFLNGETTRYSSESALAGDSSSVARLFEEGIHSLCCIPLGTVRGALGSFNLGWKNATNCSEEEIRFLEHLACRIAAALESASARREIERLTDKSRRDKLSLKYEVRSTERFAEFIGESPALKRTLIQVETVAPSEATVLILGETGTGKELIARAIHRLSSRQAGPFIKLNCAAIPTGLLESELFGHEKGAFTSAIQQKIGRVEMADGGTLFLDEVGEIPLEIQPKLLRVLEDQEFERLGGTRTIKVNCRLLAATNRELAQLVGRHEFRSDLYYRLNVFPIRMPALRERDKDISLLVRYFVQKFSRAMHKKIENIPAEAMDALANWRWPGNVRELENFVERSVILSEGPTLSPPLAEFDNPSNPRLNITLENIEREHILRVLRETGGVIAGVRGAATRLGMKRTTLQSRIQRLGISREEYQN